MAPETFDTGWLVRIEVQMDQQASILVDASAQIDFLRTQVNRQTLSVCR